MCATHIFLSPHLDDAVFSCGGTIAALVAAGHSVKVVTVTAGSAHLARLPYSARRLHSLWGLSGDVVAARREEDLSAASLLGFAPVHLDFLDAIYRSDIRGRFLYPTRDSLFPGGGWRRERPLVARLAERLSECARGRWSDAACLGGQAAGDGKAAHGRAPGGATWTVYAPLALGNHVDHQLVRQAVRRSGLSPVWYEDFPYVGSMPALACGDLRPAARWVARRLGVRTDAIRPVLVPFNPAVRVRAMRVYRSQLSTVFGTEEEMIEDVVRFLPRADGGLPAERLWYPVGGSAS